MPNKQKKFTGVYKYNEELIKVKSRNSIIKTLYTGDNKLYFLHLFLNFC